MKEFEWTNSLAINLMEEYRKRPELWNPMHDMYRVQTYKYEKWRELATMFECDIADLRKKLNSLFASHRREKAKIRAGGRSNWFLYEHMDFLPTHLDPQSGESQSSKNRPPVKEAPPPSCESDEEPEQEQELIFEEHLEEDNAEEQVADYIYVKEESPVPPVQRSTPLNTYKRVRKTQVSTNTHKPRLTRPLKRRLVSRKATTSEPSYSSSLDIRLAEALKLLRRADLTRRKDECDSFGEYIADSLRKHDDRTQAMIKQAINNIIFEQEMKKYSNQHYVVISGIDENPLILGEETDK